MKNIWNFILSNVDAWIAITVAIVAALWSLLDANVNQQILLAAISGILGTLAVSILRDRQARDTLVKEINDLRHAFLLISGGKVNAENFLLTRPKLGNLGDNLRDTETLDMAGPSLLNISTSNQAILRDLKKSGAKIRLIVSNPENTHLQKFLGARHLETESGEAHASFVRTSLSSLIPIIGEDANGGSLHIRLTDQMQGFSYVGRNTNKPMGKVHVEFYMIKTALDRNPIIPINASSDPHWFDEFRSQFEYLWQNSLELDISKYKRASRR